MKADVTFRTAVRSDVPLILRYIRELARYEELEHEVVATENLLTEWLFDREKSGLLPFDLHIHDLDLIVSMFGKPDDVIFTECAGEGKAYAEQYRFLYVWHSGLNVCAEAAWYNAAIPFTARWRVYFERGMLICDHSGVTGYSADGEVTRFDLSDPVQVDCGVNLGVTGWFYRELTHLLACAQKGEPSPFVPKQQILDVMEILDQF